jgi:hypothetical protein
VKHGAAVLVTCLVETLNDADPTLRDRFVKKLEQAYEIAKEDANTARGISIMEALSWTRQNLTGMDPVHGPGERFFPD